MFKNSFSNSTISAQSAIAQGIKTIGIGKRGSKNLDLPLIAEIKKEIHSNRIPKIMLGAFYAALIIKKSTSAEKELLHHALGRKTYSDEDLIKLICKDAPRFIETICLELIQQKTLSLKQAKKMGDFLFSDQTGEGARGFIASILRVRYETPDEYAGLLQSMNQLFQFDIPSSWRKNECLIQIADPFDGVTRIHSVTPLIGAYFLNQNYDVVNMAGASSGPKYGNNLLQLCQSLSIPDIRQKTYVKDAQLTFGVCFDQTMAVPSLMQWVQRRRLIIKRPFLATLERFVNPFAADILIASAFHAPYGEKMLDIAERAGFPGIIIVRNGMEGTINFPLIRSAKVLCSARDQKGCYQRQEMEFNPIEILTHKLSMDEKQENPSLTENVQLIKTYIKERKTNSVCFDNRVKVTCHGLEKAVKWVTTYAKKDTL